MGKVIIPDSNTEKFFKLVQMQSKTFKFIVDKVCEGGDIKYQITNMNVSWHDHKLRIISIGINTGSGDKTQKAIRNNSDVIFEMCNAYNCAIGLEPAMKNFDDPFKYGKAKEKMEWESVKLHYKIINELESVHHTYSKLNRFKPGFLKDEKPWTKFGNYLEEQIKSGHTKLIMQHHPNYKK